MSDSNRLAVPQRGIREQVLRLIGCGLIYDRARSLSETVKKLDSERSRLETQRSKLESDRSALETKLSNLETDLARREADLSASKTESDSRISSLTTERKSLAESAKVFAAALAESKSEASNLRSSLADEHDKASRIATRLEHFENLSHTGRLIELEYAIHPRVRYGGSLPEEPRMAKLLAKGEDRYRENLLKLLPFIEQASKIPTHSDQPGQPHWINGWMPAFDSISIYAQLAQRNPVLYLEIGSGSSTKFARQAIRDFNLRTRIVSIDPYPRSEIDAICDEVIRVPLEDAPRSVFARLQPGDVLFFDGSHRSFQNSDVTVFFTEILPSLRNDVLTGIHDILLPADYPVAWLGRFYNEQYLLACWLFGGDRLRVELPLFYMSSRPNLSGIFEPLWSAPNLAGAQTHGCAFWFTPTGLES